MTTKWSGMAATVVAAWSIPFVAFAQQRPAAQPVGAGAGSAPLTVSSPNKTLAVTSADRLKVHLAPGGGFVARIVPR